MSDGGKNKSIQRKYDTDAAEGTCEAGVPVLVGRCECCGEIGVICTTPDGEILDDKSKTILMAQFLGQRDITEFTSVVKDNVLYVQAGAGIVADSVPESEWIETCNKARAVVKAVELVRQSSTAGQGVR